MNDIYEDTSIKHSDLIRKLIVDDENIKQSPIYPASYKSLNHLEESVESSNSEIRPPNTPKTPNRKQKGTFSLQFNAILQKNYSLQAKQKGTNICQILTPIICLLFTMMVKRLVNPVLAQKYLFNMDLPYIFNVPYNETYGDGNPIFHGHSPLSFGTCVQWYLYGFDEQASPETQAFVGDKYSGMLSKIFPPLPELERFYECKRSGLMPYFAKPTNGTVNEEIYRTIQYFNTLTSPRLQGLSIPDGAVEFHEASPDQLTIRIQVNDLRVDSYHRNNGVSRMSVSNGESGSTSVYPTWTGQLIVADLITKSYIRALKDDIFMISGAQIMPTITEDLTFLYKIIGAIGSSLYPLALSLLLSVFMYTIVLEKEERLREIMKMNGLKMSTYWISNYLWFFGMYAISALIFLLVGKYGLKTNFFTDTSFHVLCVIIFGWGLCLVSLAIFFQNFVSKSKTATIAGYVLVVWTNLIAVTFSVVVYPTPDLIPLEIRLYPPFALSRLIYYLTAKCSNYACVRHFSEFSEEASSCIIIIYASAVLLLVLGLYLDAVLPQEFGVRKHPLFFLQGLFGNDVKVENKKKKVKLYPEDEVILIPKHKNRRSQKESFKEISEKGEDKDVKKERSFVNKIPTPQSQYPLVIKNLRKVYRAIGGKPPKVAVQNLSLHIKQGEMFGLLGPNGAGKTSLISMLTGLYSPESGNAWVGGYSILNEINMVHREIGVCPQFDLLWPELTVEEHLLFFARVRGVEKKDEKELVKKAMKEVYLTKFASFKTKQLSGGMKRRLSVAMALAGDPKIVFLDEPTTGLDPENRRQLWNILVEARANRAIILTTHSMEEADVLCNRIGIITDGALRCLGPQARLKSTYGGGYHLAINCHKEKHFSRSLNSTPNNKSPEGYYERVKKFVEELLPQAELKSEFNGNFIYLIPTKGLEVSKIFGELESRKEELAILDWGISQATLEDVFMEIAEMSQNNEEDL